MFIIKKTLLVHAVMCFRLRDVRTIRNDEDCDIVAIINNEMDACRRLNQLLQSTQLHVRYLFTLKNILL